MAQDFTVRIKVQTADALRELAKMRQSQDRTADATERMADAIDRMEKKQHGLKNTTKKTTSAMKALKAAIPLATLGLLAKATLSATVQMERINAAMSAGARTSKMAQQNLDFVRETAKRLGLDLQTSAMSFAQLTAASKDSALEGRDTRKIFEAVATASRAMGLSADDTRGALNAIVQMMSKGKVQAEELRGQLGERLPGAFRLAAKAMGVTQAELNKMLDTGQVMAEDLLPGLADAMIDEFADPAAKASSSLQAEWARLKNALFELAQTIGTDLAPALTKVLKLLTDIVEKSDEFANSKFVKLMTNPTAFGKGLGDKLFGNNKEVVTVTNDAREELRGLNAELDQLMDKAGRKAAAALQDLVREEERAAKAAEEAAKAHEKWLGFLRQSRPLEEVRITAGELPEALDETGKSFGDLVESAAKDLKVLDNVFEVWRDRQLTGWEQMVLSMKDQFEWAVNNIGALWERLLVLGINALEDLVEGNKETSEIIADVWQQAAAAVGQHFGGEAGAALGSLIGGIQGRLLGSLFEGSTPFAAGNVTLGANGLEGGNLRRNRKGIDTSELEGLIGDVIDSIQGVFDQIGLELSSLGMDIEIQQKGEDLIVNINGVQTAFQDFNKAMSFLITQIAQTAEFAGLGAEATAAIRQAAEESGENLEVFAADAQDILRIVDASSGLSDVGRRIRDEAEEFSRLMAQAERFGLDSAGIQAEFGDLISEVTQGFTDFSGAMGQGVEAIRERGRQMRQEALMINQLLRSMGLDAFLIDIGSIDEAQRAAVREERNRQLAEEQRLLEQVTQAQRSFTDRLEDILGIGDPLERQLRDLSIEYHRLIDQMEEVGLATEDLTGLYEQATAALVEQAQILELQGALKGVSKTPGKAGLTRGGVGSAIQQLGVTLFDFIEDEERAADLRFKLFLAEHRLKLAELRNQVTILEAQGLQVSGMKALLNELDDVFHQIATGPNPFLTAAEEAGDAIVSAGQQFANEIAGAFAPADVFDFNQLAGFLGGGGGSGNPFADVLATFDAIIADLNQPTGAASKQALLDKLKAGGLIDDTVNSFGELAEVLEKVKQQKLQDILDDILQPIRDFQASLFTNAATSPLTGRQRLNNLTSSFMDLVERAKAGDIDAINQLPGVGGQLLDLAKQFFGSGAGYQNIFDLVNSSLTDVGNLTVDAFDPAAASDAQVNAVMAVGETVAAGAAQNHQDMVEVIRELRSMNQARATGSKQVGGFAA